MNMWTAIALIAIAAMVTEAYRHHSKDKLSKADQRAIDSINRRLESMDSDLRKRVETLERIVTDQKENLKRQFDQLERSDQGKPQ